MAVIVQAVAAEADDPSASKRKRTVPIREWWTLAVRKKLKERGLEQLDLATKLGLHPSEVSRCISRKVPVLDFVIAISDELDIAYPVIIPDTEAEALHLAMQRRLIRRDLQLTEIKSGVGDSSSTDQGVEVRSENAVKPRTKKRVQRVAVRR